MPYTTAQAPVAFSGYTSIAGSGNTQIFPVSANGVTQGLTAGNLYLVLPQSNVMNGRKFTVKAGGWVKAHGATQVIAFGLQCFPWNTTVSGAVAASGTNTFTPVNSGQLTAGTFYDFQITQDFFGEVNADTLTCFAPTVYVAGSPVTIVTTASPITVSYASASQTEPITGINTTTDYPLASFAATFANNTSDTVETLALTQFSCELSN